MKFPSGSMIVSFIIAATLIILSALIYMKLPELGKAPSGKRLEKMQQYAYYKDGAFVNRTNTPGLTPGYSYFRVMSDFLFGKHPRLRPEKAIPHIKTDLKALPADSDILVWFGHSSYYMQLNGVRFLVDPVFSGHASPFSGSVKAFKGADAYSVDDLPGIDYLLISHDHYDHLDYQTVKALKSKVGKVICGLGTGSHLEYWGYPAEDIIEKGWDETVKLEKDITIHTLTARHFSGRLFKRNNTLWLSFLIETPAIKILAGGDSGYDEHFAETGNKYGPVDVAILENGQYNMAWHAIHCLPEETLKAARDLKAKRLMPVHSSKFSLAMHPWDEPLREISSLNEQYHIPLITPLIGEPVNLNDTTQAFTQWWKQ